MTRSVLIVDDSLTVRMDLGEAFEAAGFRPLLSASVREARAALAAHTIDLAILDVLLPDGDGVELLKELRGHPATAEVPILVLSNEADVKDRIRGLKTGADDYVGKPYEAGDVVARGLELLRLRQPETTGPIAPEKSTILLIDDSVTFREALRAALETAGYAVISAESAEKGLRLASARRPTALIVDGVMPGMDGATLIRRLRLDASLRALPCLLLTASEEQGAELAALDAGADAFVRKEEDLDVILARVAAMLRTAGTEPATSSFGAPRRILAVDDSMTYLQALAGALRDEGYDVVLAHSGEDAIEMLGVQNVDCILLDLMMPGIGGQETCRRIKANATLRNTPLIMLTAVEDRQALIEGLSTGADDYIAKSNEFDVIRARVQAQMRRKQFEDENRRIRDRLLRSELEAAEARAARELAEAKAGLVEELEYKNQELEAFSYSVSHDLRAPLRSIDGFSQALIEDYGDRLDEAGHKHLSRIRAAAQRMGALIDDMLMLARVSRAKVSRETVNLSALAAAVLGDLEQQHPTHRVALDIQSGLLTHADPGLMRILLENLLGNAWKFTGRTLEPRIEFKTQTQGADTVFFVKDNGAGFDMAHAGALFQPFQRLHDAAEFPGTGIGLATVRRVVDHHGGRIWAQSSVGAGASIFFTIPHSRGRNPR
jgi:two-component system, NtrC family, sensor kinase